MSVLFVPFATPLSVRCLYLKHYNKVVIVVVDALTLPASFCLFLISATFLAAIIAIFAWLLTADIHTSLSWTNTLKLAAWLKKKKNFHDKILNIHLMLNN